MFVWRRGITIIVYLEHRDRAPRYLQLNHSGHLQRAAQWFSDNNIEVMEWPAQSPDINPIEHLWVHVKRQMNTYETPPKGVFELWDRLAREWNKIPPETCQNFIESMPRRLEAVIKAKGGHTKY